MKKLFYISIIVLFVAGCATASVLQPDESELAKMRQKVPGITMDDLNHGYKLYKMNCAGCHQLFKPDTYTSKAWDKILPEMFSRAKLSSNEERQLIRNYLFAKSK